MYSFTYLNNSLCVAVYHNRFSKITPVINENSKTIELKKPQTILLSQIWEKNPVLAVQSD